MKKKKQASPVSTVAHKDVPQKHERLHQFFATRKLRCGATSLALTAIAVLLVILFNIFATSMEDTYALAADFSYNELTHQSDTTKAVLDALQEDVHLYLLNSGATDTLLSVNDLKALLSRYAASSSHITYSEENLVKNPTFRDRFTEILDTSTITSDCLVIYCASKGRARVLTAEDYLNYSLSLETGYYYISGLAYEKKITEGIFYVSQDELPVLQVLTGHGELSDDDMEAFTDVLKNNNYAVERVSLMTGGTLSPDSPLFILSPKVDITDDELAALLAFASEGGNFFYISQYIDPIDMPNLNALMSAFGITPLNGMCVADPDDIDSYYTNAPAILIPYMQSCDITETLIASGHDNLILGGTRAFALNAGLGGDLTIQSLLKTGSAYLRDYLDGAETLDYREGDVQGVFDVAAISDWSQANGSHARMFVIGNMNWIYTTNFADEFLLQVIQALQGKDPIDLNILPKSAYRNSMTVSSLALPTLVVLLLPLMIALIALFLLAPRKNL